MMMRRSLLAGLFVLCLPLFIHAQSPLRVEGSASLDRSAVIPQSKVDVNGIQVAGVRILTDLRRLSFESPNGVGE